MNKSQLLNHIIMILVVIILAATGFLVVRSIVLTGVHIFDIIRYLLIGGGAVFVLVFWVAALKGIHDKRKEDRDNDDY
ncbi:MAG: hypothetical protein PUC26_00215 [Eubacteriales bacterium]|jgi:hypothetical protein|nr:hypothetical protein [Eubacteriales bacterium]